MTVYHTSQEPLIRSTLHLSGLLLRTQRSAFWTREPSLLKHFELTASAALCSSSRGVIHGEDINEQEISLVQQLAHSESKSSKCTIFYSSARTRAEILRVCQQYYVS